MPLDDQVTNQNLAWLRRALKDPNQRAILRREMDAADSATPGTLASVGQAVSKAATPAGQMGAGLGGIIGLGLRALLKKKSPAASTTDTGGSSQNYSPGTGVSTTAEPQGGYSGSSAPVSSAPVSSVPASGGTDFSGATVVPSAEAWKHGATPPAIPTALPPVATAPAPPEPAPIPGSMMMGQDRSGDPILSRDGGKTWINTRTNTPLSGPAYQVTAIGNVGGGSPSGVASAAASGAPAGAAGPPTPDNLGGGGGDLSGLIGGDDYTTDDSLSGLVGGDDTGGGGSSLDEDLSALSGDDFGEGLRRGGRVRKRAFADGGRAAEELPLPPPKSTKGVLLRRPVPVISTTIVIGKKKKPDEKKKAGGAIKPKALPPKKGPGNSQTAVPTGPPAPFAKGGHVQVPRGSGCAVRGKRFRGIF